MGFGHADRHRRASIYDIGLACEGSLRSEAEAGYNEGRHGRG